MKLTNYFLNFDFGGRARRSHYWANWFVWLCILLGVLGFGVAADRGIAPFIVLPVIAVIALSLIDTMAMIFRRAHDTGRSGWIWLLLFIPLVNLLPLYWLLIEDSQQGPNKYGPPVKQFYEPSPIA